MSTSKKSSGKRKRQSPSSSSTSQIGQRLEKLRSGKRNLWDGDDDSDSQNGRHYRSAKTKTTTDNTYIVLSDSDEEKASSRKRSRSHKSKKKSSSIQNENFSSDNEHKSTSKCATCLICSILSTLTSYNCCPKHLSLLLHHKDCHHQKQTTNSEQWPPQQVMIVPMTDELLQRYLNPQDIYRLKTKTTASPMPKKSTESKRSSRKSTKKSTTTSEVSDSERPNTAKSTHMETEQISSSSDSSLPNSGTVPPDVTYTVATSTSATINSFESPNVLDTGQLQQSSDQPIIIDDSQSDDHPQDQSSSQTTQQKKQNDPWTPISDETYATIETVLGQVNQNSQDQMEFTPAIARRTPTDLMASRLPKIQLKKGRYHRGKPVGENNTPDTTTTTESRSSTISQPTSTSVITINTRPPTSLATIVEDESLVIQSTRQNSERSSQSCQILSERHNNTTECLSDTVMSSLLAQDESSQLDIIHTTTKPASHEVTKAPLATVIEEDSVENDQRKSVEISQSSQLTNDQNESQPLISSTTTDKPTTPSRISYRLNPDGSRIGISRPALTANHPSPIMSLRRPSTDATQMTSHTNK